MKLKSEELLCGTAIAKVKATTGCYFRVLLVVLLVLLVELLVMLQDSLLVIMGFAVVLA